MYYTHLLYTFTNIKCTHYLASTAHIPAFTTHTYLHSHVYYLLTFTSLLQCFSIVCLITVEWIAFTTHIYLHLHMFTTVLQHRVPNHGGVDVLWIFARLYRGQRGLRRQ